MSIVAQSPSHRGEIVELFVRDAAALPLQSDDLVMLCTRSIRPHNDQRASVATVLFRHSQPWRFCHASAMLSAFWPTSGLVQVIF